MSWYAGSLLAGPLAPWSVGIREAFQAGARAGLTRYPDTMVVSVPVALARAYLIHIPGGRTPRLVKSRSTTPERNRGIEGMIQVGRW